MHVEKLKESRKAVGEGAAVSISSGNQSFDSMMKTNFASLIANVKKRKAVEKLKQLEEKKVEEIVEDKHSPLSSVVPVSTTECYKNSLRGNEKEQQNSSDSLFEDIDHLKSGCITSEVDEDVLKKNYDDMQDLNVNPESDLKQNSLPYHLEETYSEVPDSIKNCSPIHEHRNPFPMATTPTSSSPAQTITATPNSTGLSLSNASSVTEVITAPSLDSKSPSIVGPWSCNKCTYLNTIRKWSIARCEMCDAKRPNINSKQEYFHNSADQGHMYQTRNKIRRTGEVATITIDD